MKYINVILILLLLVMCIMFLSPKTEHIQFTNLGVGTNFPDIK